MIKHFSIHSLCNKIHFFYILYSNLYHTLKCKMIKPTKKDKKMREVQPEIIELYKNKQFISDSFTADGQKTTRVLGMAADRHLLAELKLPELHERCAIVENKDLYKLSQMLAEPKVLSETAKTPTPTAAAPKEELAEVRVHRKLHKMPWRRNEHSDNESGDHKSVKQKKVLRKVLEPFGDAQSFFDDSMSFTKEKHKKKTKKQERKNLPADSSDDGDFISAKEEEEPTNKRQVRNECRAEVSPTKLKSVNIPENRLAISNNISDLSPQQLVNKFEIDPEILRLLRERFQQALQITKKLVQIIDDWHALTVLLFLGTFTYLIYILFFDINEFVNEERRYKLKLNEAGMIFKCFYYLMRLLKIPIF